MSNMLRELAWLFACAATSFVLTGALLGYQQVWPGGTLDIQLHNTYFVLGWWMLLLPLFLAAAVPRTLVRAAQVGYQQRTTTIVLAGLVLLILLILAVLGFWMWLGFHSR